MLSFMRENEKARVDIMLDGIDAVLFDLDGTLIDSMWMWEAIDIEYLKRFNIPFEKSYQKDIEGMSMTETAIYFKEHFGINDSIEKMKSDWNDMAWNKYCNEVELKEGTLSFLELLRKRNIKMGIGTSNSIELTEIVLEKKNIREYFEEVHTANEVKKGKPSPDIYLLVADKLGVSPERCLVFEDIYQGICAGINAGMKTCLVWDNYSKEYWDKNVRNADYSIKSFEELQSNEEPA